MTWICVDLLALHFTIVSQGQCGSRSKQAFPPRKVLKNSARSALIREDAPQYSNSFTIDLPYPTAFTPELFKYALRGLDAIYEKGYSYKKAGVELSDFVKPLPMVQPDLFGEVSLIKHYCQSRLMAVVDAINRILGRDTLFFAVQGMTRDWRMQQTMLSQRFTTRWDEVLHVM